MWIAVATPPFSSLDQIDAVLSELEPPPDGLEARYVGTTPDGEFRIVSLWESQGHAEQFFTNRIGPTIAKVHGPGSIPASLLVGIDVARSYVRQAVA